MCDGDVLVNGAVGVCQSCGAEYDVIRHGRGRGDFSKTAEVQMTANKIPTEARIYLWDSTRTKRMEGQTVFVGTSIIITVGVFIPSAGQWLTGQPINIWRKLDTGTWENLGPVAPSSTGVGTFDKGMTFLKSGLYTFYAEYLGNDQYAGCEETVHALSVDGQEFSASPQVSMTASPALTVIVKDAVFKKPIEGATVSVDASEVVTDAVGTAVFDTLAPGTYTLTVSARDYKSETRKVDLTTAGMVVEVGLWHLGLIALGIAGGGAVGIVVAHKVTRRK